MRRYESSPGQRYLNYDIDRVGSDAVLDPARIIANGTQASVSTLTNVNYERRFIECARQALTLATSMQTDSNIQHAELPPRTIIPNQQKRVEQLIRYLCDLDFFIDRNCLWNSLRNHPREDLPYTDMQRRLIEHLDSYIGFLEQIALHGACSAAEAKCQYAQQLPSAAEALRRLLQTKHKPR